MQLTDSFCLASIQSIPAQSDRQRRMTIDHNIVFPARINAFMDRW